MGFGKMGQWLRVENHFGEEFKNGKHPFRK
jgi:hypothetical protein